MGWSVGLFVLAVLCFLLAAVGRGATLGNATFPALGSRGGRAAIALVGVLSLVLGSVVLLGTPLRAWAGRKLAGVQPSPVTITVPAPAASASAPPRSLRTSEPATAGASGSSVASLPPLPTPSETTGIFWSGDTGIDNNGVDFDVRPPRHVSTLNISASSGTSSASLEAGAGVTISEWTTEHVPNQDECTSWLANNGKSYLDTVVVGTQVCAKTAEGRITFLRINKVQDHVEADVVVWDNK